MGHSRNLRKGGLIPGGRGEGKPFSGVNPSQLDRGTEVELEHTPDRGVAREIAMDHLTEIPDYYTRLDRMESEAGGKTAGAREVGEVAGLRAFWEYNGPAERVYGVSREIEPVGSLVWSKSHRVWTVFSYVNGDEDRKVKLESFTANDDREGVKRGLLTLSRHLSLGHRTAADAPKKYDHIDFKPPQGVADAAAKGLELRQKASPSNKGGLTPAEAAEQGIGSGVQRAVNLKNRDNISPDVIRQMHGFLSRSEKSSTIAPEHKGKPWNDKGYVAWLLWGGDPAKAWVSKILKQMEAADEKANKTATYWQSSADWQPTPRAKSACIIAAGVFGGNRVLLKNRDRNYVPEVRVYHEIRNGREILYVKDEITGWVEGMNEDGVGVVNSSLLVGRDEAEKKLVETVGKNKDGLRVLAALEQPSLDQALESLKTYMGGLKGHTFVSDGTQGYYVEMTSKHNPITKKMEGDDLYVRTNHGVEYPDSGYTEGDDLVSSVARREVSTQKLREVQGVDEIAPTIYGSRRKDLGDTNNMVRDTPEMRTVSQLVMDLTRKRVKLYLIPGKIRYLGYVDNLPSDYKPKIKFDLFKYTDIDGDGDFDVVKRKPKKKVDVKTASLQAYDPAHDLWGSLRAAASKTPLYVGVILDDPQDLLAWWKREVGSLLPKHFAHHMTIKFKPSSADLDALAIGMPIDLHVIGWADNGKIQAVAVNVVGVDSANKVPHVTVATDGGTPPMESNALLEKGFTRVQGPTLKGRVGLSYGPSKDVFEWTRTAAADTRAGDGSQVGVFAPLPPELAKQFPDKKEDKSPPHVTLAYLGDVPNPEDQKRLVESVKEFYARETGPIKARLMGVDYFRQPQGSVSYSRVVFVQDMGQMRDRLLSFLGDRGFKIQNNYPVFTPHVTLAYNDAPDAVWDGKVPVGSWSFNQVEIWGLPQVHTIPLLGQVFSKSLTDYVKKERALRSARLIQAWGLPPKR